MKHPTPGFVAILSFVVAGCHRHGGGSAGHGSLTLEATDTPFAHDIVTEATIRIDRISIAEQVGPSAQLIRLYEGPPLPLDLAVLRDGLTERLLERGIPNGTWRQIRIHLVGARLVLTNGAVFDTDDGDLLLAAQDANGYPVTIDPPIQTASGIHVRELLDFDLPRSFVPDVPADPLSATSFLLSPMMRLADLAVSGGVRGLVTGPDGSGGTAPVPDATVYVLPAGMVGVANALSSTATGANGSYADLALPGGVYDLLVVKGAMQELVTGVSVTEGAVTIADVAFP